MEIINAHVHMIELMKMIQTQQNLTLQGDIAVLKNLESTLPLLSPEVLIAQMDEAGISKSVLFAVDAPIVYSSNEYIYSLCSKYPDRLIGFASVNPNNPDAPDLLEKAIKKFNLKGIKFHPPLQNFFPNDKAVFSTYEKAVELNLPVVFHVGTTPFGSMCRLSQANPLLIDDVAVEFSDLRIMLTHLGTLWHNEAFMVVEKNPNVFIDTAAYLYELNELLTLNLIERIGSNKIIFGTDYPMPYAGRVHKMKDFVDCIQSLDLSNNILKGIFQDNFNNFLSGAKEAAQEINAVEMMNKLKALVLKE